MNMKKYTHIALLVLVYGAFAFILWPFAQAMIFAALFAFALNPILARMKRWKKVKLNDFKAISLLILGLIGVVFLPLAVIIVRVATLISQFNADNVMDSPLIQKGQAFVMSLFEKLNSYAQSFGFDLSSQIDVKSHAAGFGKTALAFATAILANIPSAIFQFIIFIALLYYFLKNQARLKASLINSGVLSPVLIDRLNLLLIKICNLVLVSTIIIAFLQATVVSIGALIVGYEGVLIIFTIAFFLAFVPVLGSGPITFALIVYALINANYGHAVVLTVVAVIAGTLDNVIKTYLFSSEKESVSPLISLLTIIGSMSMFGPLGLFLGPVIAELAVKIGKIVEEE